MSDNDLDEFEQAVQRSLSRVEAIDESQARTCREESIQMFEIRIRKVRWITWSFLSIDIAAMVAAAVFLQNATSTRMMIWSAIMFMVAFEGTVLVKLWYWVVSGRISVLQELKKLELLLAVQLPEKEQ